jgi:alpha-beta hydrolase superfamily lysophospholipase
MKTYTDEDIGKIRDALQASINVPCYGGHPQQEEALAILGRPIEQGELREALEVAKTGLEWYHDTYPESVNECDYEAMRQINKALKEKPNDVHHE